MTQSQEDILPVEANEEVSENDLLDLLFRGADEIRQTLKIGESDFRFLRRAHNSRGRDHYVYAVLDEVEQVAFALKMTLEVLDGPPDNIPDDELSKRLIRNTMATVEREQALHIRRLTEVLVDLINFSQTNTNAYYDHYLLYKELSEHRKRQEDFKRYFNCTNLNTQTTIDLTKRSITYAEGRLQLNKCWYLQGNNPNPNGEAKMASFVSIFDKALPIADKAERFALGFYYGRAYREPSQTIHLNIGGITSRRTFDSLIFRRGQIWLLAVHCLNRCRRLLNIRSKKGVGADLSKAINASLAEGLYRQYTQPQITKGDFVIVFDSVCEVVGTAKSKFGYKSFKVRYLSRPPIPEQTEDWFPAINVRKLADGKDLREGVIRLLSAPSMPVRIDPKIIRKSMRQSVLKLWEEYLAALRRRGAGTPARSDSGAGE
jgi:hypothetical protein